MVSKLVILDRATKEVHVVTVDKSFMDENTSDVEKLETLNDEAGFEFIPPMCSVMHVEDLSINIH